MLIFDFDGILLDSVLEAGVSAYNAVTGKVVTRLDELPPGFMDSYLLNRFHFQPAGDNLLLVKWCLDVGAATPARRLTVEEYRQLLTAADTPLVERTVKFFSTRKLFIEKDRDAWLAMNRPYAPLWDALIAAGAERVVILTNKNSEAVIELTHHFGLKIQRENVYAGDGGATKIENLRRIHQRFASPYYLFVDDSIGNLRELGSEFADSDIRLKLALGAWGYLGPEDREIAPKEGFQILEQADIIRLLEEELPK